MEIVAIYLLMFPVELTNPIDIVIAETAIRELSKTEEFNYIPFHETYYCTQTFTEFLQKNDESWNKVREFPRIIEGIRFGIDYHYAAKMRMFFSVEKSKVSEVMILNQDRIWQFEGIIDDYNWKYKCWDALEDGLSPYNTFEFKRKRLQDLRELIGDDMWFRAEMP